MQVDEVSSIWARPQTTATRERIVALPDDERVRYAVMHDTRADWTVGPIGALWVSEDGARGGFESTSHGWLAQDMRRNYESALARGWTPGRIFTYWTELNDEGQLLVDPPQDAASLNVVRYALGAA
jgi:hypothetical protein